MIYKSAAQDPVVSIEAKCLRKARMLRAAATTSEVRAEIFLMEKDPIRAGAALLEADERRELAAYFELAAANCVTAAAVWAAYEAQRAAHEDATKLTARAEDAIAEFVHGLAATVRAMTADEIAFRLV